MKRQLICLECKKVISEHEEFQAAIDKHETKHKKGVPKQGYEERVV